MRSSKPDRTVCSTPSSLSAQGMEGEEARSQERVRGWEVRGEADVVESRRERVSKSRAVWSR
jgi:hypothetical protein